jgi:hypothetical protein
MAEMYGTQSPYHFAGNNPINNLEINGAFWQEAVADGIERDMDEWGNVASGGTGTRTTYRGPTTFFGSGGYYGVYGSNGYMGSSINGRFYASNGPGFDDLDAWLENGKVGSLGGFYWHTNVLGKSVESWNNLNRPFSVEVGDAEFEAWDESPDGSNPPDGGPGGPIEPGLGIDEVMADIRNSGLERFLQYVLDPNYGAEFFNSDVENFVSANILGGLIQSSKLDKIYPSYEMVLHGVKMGEWGHTYLHEYDEMRHIIGAFLMTKKYGEYNAFYITSCNEAYGFFRFDIWRLSTRLKEGGWAYELSDYYNNYIGIELAKKY